MGSGVSAGERIEEYEQKQGVHLSDAERSQLSELNEVIARDFGDSGKDFSAESLRSYLRDMSPELQHMGEDLVRFVVLKISEEITRQAIADATRSLSLPSFQSKKK